MTIFIKDYLVYGREIAMSKLDSRLKGYETEIEEDS